MLHPYQPRDDPVSGAAAKPHRSCRRLEIRPASQPFDFALSGSLRSGRQVCEEQGEFTRPQCRARVMSANERSELVDHPWIGRRTGLARRIDSTICCAIATFSRHSVASNGAVTAIRIGTVDASSQHDPAMSQPADTLILQVVGPATAATGISAPGCRELIRSRQRKTKRQ